MVVNYEFFFIFLTCNSSILSDVVLILNLPIVIYSKVPLKSKKLIGLENFEIFKKKQHSEIYLKIEIKEDCAYSQRGQKPYPLVVACNDFPEKVCVCCDITFPNDITFMSRHGRLINFNGKFGFFSR